MLIASLSTPCPAVVTLGAPQVHAVDGPPLQVEAADINRDGRRDLLVFSDSGSNGATVSVLVNQGALGFGAPNPRLVTNAGRYIGHAFAVADFDGDGSPDIAVAVTRLEAAARSGVVVFLNDGTGRFRTPVEFALDGFFPACAVTADVDGDGVTDLLICQSTLSGGRGLITVLLGPLFDRLGTAVVPPRVDRVVGTSPTRAEIADLDGDGRRDAVVMDPEDGAVYLLYSEPHAGGVLETTRTLSSLAQPQAVQVVPVPGGLPSLAVADGAAPRLLSFVQRAPRQFATPASVNLVEASLDLVAADFDGDTRTDVAILGSTRLSILGGDALGGFTAAASMDLDLDGERVFAGDLLGDAQPDLILTLLDDDAVAIVPVRAVVRLPGDADCNGAVEPADLPALVAAIFADGCAGADVNADGAFSAADLPALLPLLPETAQP